MALTLAQQKLLLNFSGYLGVFISKIQRMASDPNTNKNDVYEECKKIEKLLNSVYSRYSWVKVNDTFNDAEMSNMRIT